jgi:hypothetical protein
MGRALEQLKRSRVRVVGKKSHPNNLRKFLNELERTGVWSWACDKAGFSTTASKYYVAKSEDGDAGFFIQWRDVEGPFHELVQIALNNAVDRIEGHAFHRASGFQEVLTHKGHVTYEVDWDKVNLEGAIPGTAASFKLDEHGRPIPATVEKQSEDLQMFILRARKPEIYGQKAQLDVNHKGGVLVVGTRAKSSEEHEAAEKVFLEKPILDVEFREVADDDK